MGQAEIENRAIRQTLAVNLARLEEAIAAACRAANRPRSEVELVAVSKIHPTAAIVEAFSLGLKIFGENRVQEFAAKSAELDPSIRSQIRAHLIGHLQSNKASKAVEIFDAVDSLDSLKLAEKLNEAAASLNKRLPVLLEIKLSHEDSKTGLAPDSPELTELLDRLPSLANLEAQGLMTIAPFNVPEAETRDCFHNLRQLQVNPIPTVGEVFDPRIHEALGSVERDDLPDQHVAEEVRRGYRLRERLLRPALVRVVHNPKQIPE